jgi:apolipoprotein N-acyltransferase
VIGSPSEPEPPRVAWLRHGLPAIAAGIALALAFPRYEWDGAAWVALAPVLSTALGAAPRAALGWGWLAGVVFFAALLEWLVTTFQVYSAIPWPIVYGPVLLLAAYCGLYTGLVAAAVAWIRRRRSVGEALLAAPFLWVAGEWVRGHLLWGFPWGTLGYSQYHRLAVIQVAELAGVDAVSFLVVAVNAAITGCFFLSWRRAVAGALLAAGLVGGALGFGAWRLAAPPPPAVAAVSIVQPSISQVRKWDQAYVAEILGTLFALTREAGERHPALIVWPETATPSVLRRDRPLTEALARLAGELDTGLLVGSIDVSEGPALAYQNTAFLLTSRGIEQRYDKIRLVPFGEFIPLSGVLGFVRGWAEFIGELQPGSRAEVFAGPPAPFGVMICYEGIFSDLVRRFVQNGARLMVNMTNDGWFGRTSGPLQHLAMYPFRAVEHRTAVVRAANTGISAFITPRGEIVRRLDLYERGVLTHRVPLREGQTLYTRLGAWLAYLGLAVSGLVLAHAAARGRAC